MSDLKMSPVVSALLSGNNVFTAKRISGQQLDGLLDPIIGFDHFQLSSDVFGPHPHAGMSAITYLFEDSAPFRNLDSIGTNLVIQPGSLQWTFAGRGVVHNEFPEIDGQHINGLQLFINIPSAKKQMVPASYHIHSDTIPEINENGARVRVVSGSTGNTINEAATPEPLTFLDMFLPAGSSYKHALPAGWNGTVYLVTGQLKLSNKAGERLLNEGDVVAMGGALADETISFEGIRESQLLFISGKAIHEPIYQAGSFAMSSAAELSDTMEAYKHGKMGFVKVKGTERIVTLPVD
ncbi:pirin-like C-terminal cupin domain-containing protein [Mucilaginibacter sp. CAU 1740]|uniref:pirin family protein n=1 Tax=Mucilaginibacter sp. CAU 1740 TaxID=3140365 RepID=UPI00325A873B